MHTSGIEIRSHGAACVKPRIFLAPMANVTDSAMRVISAEGGAQECRTEMVGAAGLARGALRTFQFLERLPCERTPLTAHIYGSDPYDIEKASAEIRSAGGFAGLEINGGCPVPKVMRSGAGAALMDKPALIERLVAAAVSGSGGMPVSFKTRAGFDPGRVTVYDCVRAAENGGASAVVVHGRFVSAMHSGPVRRDLIRCAVEAVGIPVIANGGVRSGGDAVSLLAETGAAGVMVGQGAMGNPWIFEEIGAAFRSEPAPPRPDFEAILGMLIRHLALSMELRAQVNSRFPEDVLPNETPEAGAVHDFRRFMFHYFRGMRGVTDLRREMDSYRTVEDIISAARERIARCRIPDAGNP